MSILQFFNFYHFIVSYKDKKHHVELSLIKQNSRFEVEAVKTKKAFAESSKNQTSSGHIIPKIIFVFVFTT